MCCFVVLHLVDGNGVAISEPLENTEESELSLDMEFGQGLLWPVSCNRDLAEDCIFLSSESLMMWRVLRVQASTHCCCVSIALGSNHRTACV